MPADIVECPNLAVLTTHDDNRVLADIDGREIAGLRHIGFGTDIEPVPRPDRIHIKVENFLAYIKGRFERVAALTPGDQNSCQGTGVGKGTVGVLHILSKSPFACRAAHEKPKVNA